MPLDNGGEVGEAGGVDGALVAEDEAAGRLVEAELVLVGLRGVEVLHAASAAMNTNGAPRRR